MSEDNKEIERYYTNILITEQEVHTHYNYSPVSGTDHVVVAGTYNNLLPLLMLYSLWLQQAPWMAMLSTC